ncbi:methyl-accepting chemotaxis protein [Pseudoalteromonas sp. SMS1]|uniref:methyl-accepting chemotaxis protein n=1 Tax=Pseudoalteromonas sp. SMS1 TaxID=2908894 RepID=UPI001F1CA9F5|nr:methyl-accepting chemotaxis protein [Pseudoalteromonas sp. SMS1]MCF2858852.1 methyl-accepting chemotaxis protein [Pseudoalteromonas sp. SMS1]
MVKNWRLNQQLNSAFGVMIFMMLILSIVAYWGLSSGYNNFVEYRTKARDNTLAGRIQANLLEVRLQAGKYLKHQSPNAISQFNQRLTLLEQLMSDAKNQFQDPAQLQVISRSQQQVERYKKSFENIVSLFERRHRIVDEVLNQRGPQLDSLLSSMIRNSQSLDDIRNLSVLRGLLQQGRLSTNKFLVTNSQQDYQAAKQSFVTLQAQFQSTLANTNRADLAQSSQEFKLALDAYQDGQESVYRVILERNQQIAQVLDTVGPEVASQLENIKLDIKASQDKLGPIVQSASANSKFTVVVFASMIILLGLFFSWYISKIIKLPIGGEPKEIEAMARKIAAGDLTVKFDNHGTHTGIYQAMASMVQNLRTFIEQIHQSTDTLAETSQTMSAITAQAKQGAEQQMAQLEYTDRAMDEMTETVSEITRSTQSAADTATSTEQTSKQGLQAVSETRSAISLLKDDINNVSDTISKLADETQSVGSILDVIRGIADQTNLLALNAAIEAARAGEQGRGFAVVADEVRSLASRTQQSTEEIQAMISRLQQEAQRSVELMSNNVNNAEITAQRVHETGQALEHVSDSVISIRDMSIQIASATEEQNAVTLQISEGVREVTSTAKDTAQGAEHASNDAAQLAKLAEELATTAKRYQL